MEKISDKVGLSQNHVSEIIGNTNIGNIDTLFAQGHDVKFVDYYAYFLWQQITVGFFKSLVTKALQFSTHI
ncbi:hypothetical protein [Desulfobacula sp.]